MIEKIGNDAEGRAMTGKKLLAALMGGFVFFTIPATTWLPEVYAAAKKKKDDGAEKQPPRQKGGQPEVLTYERAMEIENKRHEQKLELIWKSYKHHPPKLRQATQRENAFHAKRIEEINKKYGRG